MCYINDCFHSHIVIFVVEMVNKLSLVSDAIGDKSIEKEKAVTALKDRGGRGRRLGRSLIMLECCLNFSGHTS